MLRVIHVWSEGGTEHVFFFLVATEPGIEFELRETETMTPLFECGTDTSPQEWVS